MKAKTITMLLFISLLAAVLYGTAGCLPGQDLNDEPAAVKDIDKNELIDDQVAEMEKPLIPEKYYWPELNYGQLVLSSTEIIIGPSPIESDAGFIAEYTADYSYSGQVVWLVNKTDVFNLEWATLTFNVNYYDQHELEQNFTYIFEIEDLAPEDGIEGVQEFTVDLVRQKGDFEVKINKIILGKEQEGSITAGPINYVALEIEMAVVDKP